MTAEDRYMLRRFRKLSRTKLMVILFVAAYGIAGIAGGCGAYKRPPDLTADERALLRAEPLPYSVTVAWWDDQTKTGQSAQAYGDALAKIVVASRSFKTSRYERTSHPTAQDLVATSTGLYCNTAIVPVLSIVSIGIIPTVFEDEHCEGMLLRRSAGAPNTSGVRVEVRSKQPVILGWVAVVAGLLPGWSHGSVENDSRLAERFRLEVLRHRDEIDHLATR